MRIKFGKNPYNHGEFFLKFLNAKFLSTTLFSRVISPPPAMPVVKIPNPLETQTAEHVFSLGFETTLVGMGWILNLGLDHIEIIVFGINTAGLNSCLLRALPVCFVFVPPRLARRGVWTPSKLVGGPTLTYWTQSLPHLPVVDF